MSRPDSAPPSSTSASAAERADQAPSAGGPLAELLLSRGQSVMQRFSARVSSTPPAQGLNQAQLADHVPRLMRDLAAALADGASTPQQILELTNRHAEDHGEQRQRLGYDINELVREYGILRDCIYQELEEAGATPSLRELRILSDCLSSAIADSLRRYSAEQRQSVERERRHLLELFQQAPGFVCFLRGREMVFEIANAAYYQLIGHRDVLGKTAREALPEVVGQGFFELLEQVFDTGQPFVGKGMKVSLQRQPGGALEEASVDFVYQPIRALSGEVIGILAQGFDTSELKRQERQRQLAEDRLRASEERYRTLFQSIDDGYCLMEVLLDQDGKPHDYRFLEANDAFAQQTGLHNPVGHTARELVPTLDASWFELYGKVALTGEPARFENHAPAMNRWFEAYANRVGDPQLRQVALVFKDITERRRLEQERERLYNAELAARKAAEQASSLKDEFLATVSHELRTPLNAVVGWAHVLRDEGLAPDKRRRAVETIERNARAQAQLIDDLLDVSRILAGKLRLEPVLIELSGTIEAALDTVKHAAEAKAIALHVELQRGLEVTGDPHRLQQVVWNLLSNAVKFTPAGGTVKVSLEREAGSAKVAVSDSGRGIEPEFLAHVFERFRQAEGGSTRAQGGLGLGLSIVRELVELHGGTVSASSGGVGQGATFEVRIPLELGSSKRPAARRARTSSLPSDVPCPPEVEGLQVLVVDDEHDAREMLRALLEKCGARVQVTSSAEECLSTLQAAPPDVLISDIGMPKDDGYALIREVRKLSAERGGDVAAIALTAYARPKDRTRTLLAGFNGYVAKPVDPLELMAVIASLSVPTRRRARDSGARPATKNVP